MPAESARLPEDAIAGKRSEQQWREHMAFEERERQMIFDRQRLRQHRALVRFIKAARARYDRARDAKALQKARDEAVGTVAELRRRVTEIDPWGVNSRLLSDYEALAVALGGPYPEAKLATFSGKPQAFGQVRAEFDRHLQTMADWLVEVERTEDEGAIERAERADSGRDPRASASRDERARQGE